MSEVIVITSGKGGVGKTTTTANVGTGLAQLNKKVVMIDTDIGLRNLDVVMGLENRIVYNLVDVVEGNCRIKQALIKDKKYPNLFLLPSAQTRDKTSVTPEQMQKLVEELRLNIAFRRVLLLCIRSRVSRVLRCRQSIVLFRIFQSILFLLYFYRYCLLLMFFYLLAGLYRVSFLFVRVGMGVVFVEVFP